MTRANDDQIICGEGYGPGGVAVIVTCRERTEELAAAVRAGFAAHGGQCGAAGSVAYLFKVVGIIEFPAGMPQARLCDAAFEAGAEDVVPGTAGSLQVLTDPEETGEVHARLVQLGCRPGAVRVAQRAAAGARLDAREASSLQGLLAGLQAIQGVTHVYSNAEVSALLA